MCHADEGLAARLLVEAREETAKADGKANVLLAFLGVALGALVAALIVGDWSPSNLPPAGMWLWWPGAVCLGASVCAAAAAVWPRFSAGKLPSRITYWGEAGRAKTPEELDKLLARPTEDLPSRSVQQFWVLSRIVILKYRLIRWSLVLAAVGSGLCLGAALAGLLS